MTKDELKDLIFKMVEVHNGMKGMELVVGVQSQLCEKIPFPTEAATERFAIFEALNEMVQSKDLIELEYELRSVPGRLKSFYLPGRGATVTHRFK